MLVDMIFVRMVEVTIVQIVYVATVAHGGMSAARPVLMRMVGMGWGRASRHGMAKSSGAEREGNSFVRAARVLARDDKIDVKTLADRAFMSTTSAERCKQAWDAVIAALREAGRLKARVKAKPATATTEVMS